MMYSIIVPTTGSSRDLRRLFTALANQDFTSDSEVLLVVTGVKELCEFQNNLPPLPGHFNVHIINCAQPGIAVARNLALQFARGRYLMFLDDDCSLPQSGYLTALTHYLESQQHPQSSIGIAGEYLSHKNTTSLASQFYNYLSNLWLMSYLKEDSTVSVSLGGCAVIPRMAVISSCARFNEHSGKAAEEYEFYKQLCASGTTVQFSQRFSVYHNPECTWKSLVNKAWNHGRALSHYPAGREQHRWRAYQQSFKARPLTSLFFLPLLFAFVLCGRLSLNAKRIESLFGATQRPYLKRS